VNTIEDGARAAMREIAETVTDAPPLRLSKARLALPASVEARKADEHALRTLPAAAKPAAGRRQSTGRVRRLPAWLAPLAAAAAVVTIALSLVILKSHQRESVVPPSAPVFVPAGSVPRYFAELDPAGDPTTSPSGLLIADTYTGKQVATVAPPAGLTFTSVSGASDDRTFVMFATPSGSGNHATGTWYELRIAPGSAHPVTLTRLPVAPLPDAIAMAVSGSGQELAVVRWQTTKQPVVLAIYSLATGRLLHSWSTPYGSHVMPGVALDSNGPLADWPLLTWVDGDRGITFPGAPSITQGHYTWTIRRLNVTAKGSSLAADSRVVWTGQSLSSGRDKYGCDLFNPMGVSQNGRTFVCASGTPKANGNRLMKWLAYPSGVNPRGRLLYQKENNMGSGTTGYNSGLSDNDVVLWTNQSGSTVIVLWYRFSPPGYSGTGVNFIHFGVISNGRFFPLPASLIKAWTLYTQAAIAW
jgi:hypothetical protein